LIVVDANVIAYAFIVGDKTDLARKLKEVEPDWRVPRIWREEFENVLAVHVRAGRLKRDQALETMAVALETIMPGEIGVDPLDALDIAIHLHVSSYDAQYLALARKHGVILVTEDVPLHKAAHGTAKTMGEFMIGKNTGEVS